MSRRFNRIEKTELTRSEAAKCYLLNRYCGVLQHDLSLAFSVNPGRVNKAIQIIEIALKDYEDDSNPAGGTDESA